jgi:hypothetical protein
VGNWGTVLPLVFVVAPPVQEESEQQEGARRSLHAWSTRRGWGFIARRTRPFRVSHGSNTGRPMQVMEPFDAEDLYRAMHRRATIVVQIGRPVVMLDPSARISPRNTVSLERFVRYKGLLCRLGRVDSTFDPAKMLDELNDRVDAQSCSGERDARCIPLHVFSPSRDWITLDESDGVVEFEKMHGRPANRKDDCGRHWHVANALHGKVDLAVCGFQLRTGFHWDVESVGGDSRLCTTTEVWKFTRRSYCNVYPDAAVRAGQRKGSTAKRVFQAARPATLDETPVSRTARRSRRKR